jgi:hypothetical protein
LAAKINDHKMKQGIRRHIQKVAVAVCGIILSSAAHADTPSPIMAESFENQDAVKSVFGPAVQLVPGRQGNGLTGGRFSLKNPASAEQGTVMAWVKLEERNPAGVFQNRWLKLAGLQVGPGGSNTPFFIGKSGASKGSVMIELNDWHHWACVWNGAKCQLYVDGHIVQDGEMKTPFASPPAIDLILVDSGSRSVIDDLKIYSQALSADQIAAAAPAPDPGAVAYDERQLVENPTFAPNRNNFPAGLIPSGWDIGKGNAAVKTDANGLSGKVTGEEAVSVVAAVKRGMLVSGRIYQVGIYYRLKKDKGRALLRFRNEIDQGTREFELPAGEWQRQFFYAEAPEDYDAGLFYLEALIEGADTEFGLRGIYCREATEAEIREAKLTFAPAAAKRSSLVTPDERWIEDVPSNTIFMKSTDREAAWADGIGGILISEDISSDGVSFWFEHSPKDFWQRLNTLREKGGTGALRLSVKPPTAKDKSVTVPGGYGMDPLTARSVHAAALLFGIGAVDSALSTFQFKRLRDKLREFGYFNEQTVFLPFWERKGFYKARYESRENPPDLREVFKGKADDPLFGHTAPGVLVSGYQNGNKLLLVLVNTTDQNIGKIGDLWVDQARVFGLKPGDTSVEMLKGVITATDIETGIKGTVTWNRNGGGYISDYWFNVAIEPGDYRLILVEYKK